MRTPILLVKYAVAAVALLLAGAPHAWAPTVEEWKNAPSLPAAARPPSAPGDWHCESVPIDPQFKLPGGSRCLPAQLTKAVLWPTHGATTRPPLYRHRVVPAADHPAILDALGHRASGTIVGLVRSDFGSAFLRRKRQIYTQTASIHVRVRDAPGRSSGWWFYGCRWNAQPNAPLKQGYSPVPFGAKSSSPKELTNGCSSALDLRSDLFADTPIERWQTHQT